MAQELYNDDNDTSRTFITTCCKEIQKNGCTICFTKEQVEAIRAKFPKYELSVTRMEEWYYIVKVVGRKIK